MRNSHRSHSGPSLGVGLVLAAALAVGLFVLPGSAHPVAAQQNVGQVGGLPNVFFDCQGPRCDRQYYRTEIDWVNWVRDQQDADVHIIMTSQNTGAGGREFQIDVMGREDMADFEDQIFFRTLSTDTEREELDGVTYALSLALAQFANAAGYTDLVEIQGLRSTTDPGAAAGDGIVSPGQVDDPWNLWVFRINLNGNYDGESNRTTIQGRAGINASRTTPTWKSNFGADVNYRDLEQELSSGSTFVDERTDWGLNARVVYSLADHWSIGFNSRTGRNTRQNQQWMAQFNPAIEYSYFPYEEATRRALTAYYEIGPVYRDYIEETIYDETEQLLAEQQFTLEFSQRQTWGDASIRVRASSYLDNFQRNNVEVNGNLGLRITRGLDLNLGASYARVRDQIYLSGQDLTDEERLLELQQQGTEYEASVFMGISYQFGSIYNNVVNNRFPGGGGGRRGFF